MTGALSGRDLEPNSVGTPTLSGHGTGHMRLCSRRGLMMARLGRTHRGEPLHQIFSQPPGHPPAQWTTPPVAIPDDRLACASVLGSAHLWIVTPVTTKMWVRMHLRA